MRWLNQRTCSRSIDLTHLKTLYQFDDAVTAPLNGFAGADDYYTRCSCKPFLKHIHTPTLIIQAEDDPFMAANSLPDQQAMSTAVYLEVTHAGGHVGFFSQKGQFSVQCWLSQRIPAYLQPALFKKQT